MNKFLVLAVMALVSTRAHALADLSACDVPEQAKQVSLSLEADMASQRQVQREKEVALENEITAETKALVSEGVWTEVQRIDFFKNMMTDKVFLADEEAKKAGFTTFMTHAMSFEASLGKQQYKEACQSSLHMRDQLQAVSNINLKQYNYMLDTAKAARKSKP